MTVVIDTNVWISALMDKHRRGVPYQALKKADVNGVIATCEPIEAEIARVLRDKFSWSTERITMAMEPFRAEQLRVAINGQLRVCQDPDDDMILECAELAGAEVIVTGDKDLLVLGEYGGVRILTPAQYLALPE